MNRASKKTLGMSVYSVREGQNLGTVKTMVVDPAEKSIIALVIERKRMTREERIVPFCHVQNIGDDVIIVDKASSVERKANLPHIIRQMRTPLHLLGARVFTVGGKTVGKVEDFHFDTKSGKIALLEIGGATGAIFKEKVNIDGRFIITIANGTVMLDDLALENQEVIENPLLNTIGSAKEKASDLINETINASKRLSKNISNSWEKLNNSEADGYLSFDEEKAAANSETAVPLPDSTDATPVSGEADEEPSGGEAEQEAAPPQETAFAAEEQRPADPAGEENLSPPAEESATEADPAAEGEDSGDSEKA